MPVCVYNNIHISKYLYKYIITTTPYTLPLQPHMPRLHAVCLCMHMNTHVYVNIYTHISTPHHTTSSLASLSCSAFMLYACVCIWFHACMQTFTRETGWRRPIGCLKMHIVFRKRATNHRALWRKITFKDKASYGSSPPCTTRTNKSCRTRASSFERRVVSTPRTKRIHTNHATHTECRVGLILHKISHKSCHTHVCVMSHI